MEDIEFCISKEQLEDALNFLLPFVPEEGKKEDEDDEDSKSIDYGKLHNHPLDAVCFDFYANYLEVSFEKDSIRVEQDINNDYTNIEGVSFFIPIHYFLNKIKKYDLNKLRFEEHRFFGFDVYDADKNIYLFSVQVFYYRISTDLSQNESDDNPFYFKKQVFIENQILRNSLSLFSKYCDYSESQYYYSNSIWYSINEGKCEITSTDGHIMKFRRYNTSIKGNYEFTIPAYYADRISDVIWQLPDMEPICISINDKKCRINCDKKDKKRTIYCDINDNHIPDFGNVLKNEVSHTYVVSTKQIQGTIRRIESIHEYEDYVVMHFMANHVNVYYRDDIENIAMYEFVDAPYGDGDFTVVYNFKYLKLLMSEIYSDNVKFIFTRNDFYLFILDDSETIGSDSFRFVTPMFLTDELKETLEKGDYALSRHKNYINKYNMK